MGPLLARYPPVNPVLLTTPVVCFCLHGRPATASLSLQQIDRLPCTLVQVFPCLFN